MLHQINRKLTGVSSWNIQITWSRKRLKFEQDPVRRNSDQAFREKRGIPSWWDKFTHLVPLVFDFIGDDKSRNEIEARLRNLYANYEDFYQELTANDRADLEKILMTFIVAHTYLIPIEALGDAFTYDESLMCQIYKYLPPATFHKVHRAHSKITWNKNGALFKNSSVCNFIAALSSRLAQAEEHVCSDPIAESNFIDEGNAAFEEAAFKQRALEGSNLLNNVLKKHFPSY